MENKGTMWFISQVSATPDLDNLAKNDTKRNMIVTNHNFKKIIS